MSRCVWTIIAVSVMAGNGLAQDFSIGGPVQSASEPLYQYDDLDRLISSVDPISSVITYTYDAVGRNSQMNVLDAGVFTYAYDANSRLTLIQNPQGARTSFSYDAAGRQTVKDLVEVGFDHGWNGFKAGDRTRLTEGMSHRVVHEVAPRDDVHVDVVAIEVLDLRKGRLLRGDVVRNPGEEFLCPGLPEHAIRMKFPQLGDHGIEVGATVLHLPFRR